MAGGVDCARNPTVIGCGAAAVGVAVPAIRALPPLRSGGAAAGAAGVVDDVVPPATPNSVSGAGTATVDTRPPLSPSNVTASVGNGQPVTIISNGTNVSIASAETAAFRQSLGLPAAGSAADVSSIARLEVNGAVIYGINAHGQRVTGVNVISSTHAEIDVLNQISQQGINVRGQSLTLYVDRAPCRACGINGGIRSMVERLGLSELVVISPQGRIIVRPRQ